MKSSCPYGYFDYVIQKGDNIEKIARRFSASQTEIIRLNPDTNPRTLKIGETIKIPSSLGGCEKGRFYRIKKGDTLFRIANRSGLTLKALLEANPYLNPDYYITGQIIIIPQKAGENRKSVQYRVKQNETIGTILRRFDMSVKEFNQQNPNINALYLKPGDMVRVHEKTPKTINGSDGFVYTVEKDENMVTVAEKFGVAPLALLKANPEVRPLEFTAGQKVIIPGKKK